MLQQSWKKICSRTTTKPNCVVFCQQNGPEHGQLQHIYPDKEIEVVPFVWMVDVVLQGPRVLYRINKDEGDESLPFLSLFEDILSMQIFWNIQRKADYPQAM